MDFSLGHALRARWITALTVWVLTIGTTLGVSLLLPPQFVAGASLVLDLKPDPIAGAYPGQMATSLVTTQVDVMTSDRVARRVVRNLRLTDNPTMKALWQEETQGRLPMEAWLLESLRKRLEVRPSRDSNVIQVMYRAGNAKQAAQMANAFVQAYLDTALELRVEPAREFAGFFEERAREARLNLAQAQARLSDFQQRQGLLATDEKLDIESARLAELSSQWVAAQGQHSDTASRVRTALHRPTDELPEVISSSLIGSLKAERSRLAARLEELDARGGPQHPQRLETAAALAAFEARIDEESRRVVGGLQAQDETTRNRSASLQAQMAMQRSRVMELKAARDEAAVLSREVDNAQRAFDALVSRRQLTQLESLSPQAQAAWLTQAMPPSEPDSPRLVLNLVLATFFGALLALAAAVVRDGRSKRRA